MADFKKVGKRSKRKGADGEREVASILRSHGFNARRGEQYCGANGDADVVGLPGIHIEVKRVERLELYTALSQSKHDARDGEQPIVIHRKNNCDWVVIQPLEDWLKLYAETDLPDMLQEETEEEDAR